MTEYDPSKNCLICGFGGDDLSRSCETELRKHGLTPIIDYGCWKSVEEVLDLRPCDMCAFKDMGKCDDCNDVKSSWKEVKRTCENCRHSYRTTGKVCAKKNCLGKSCWEKIITGDSANILVGDHVEDELTYEELLGAPMSFTEPLLFNTLKSDDTFDAISYADIEKLTTKNKAPLKAFREDYLDMLRPYDYSNRLFKIPDIPINKPWHDDFMMNLVETPTWDLNPYKSVTQEMLDKNFGITSEQIKTKRRKTMRNTREVQKEKMKMAGETAMQVSAGRVLNTTIKEALGKVSKKIPLDNALATGVIALLTNIGIDNTRFKDSKKAQAVLQGMYINAGLEGVDATGVIQLIEGVIESALNKIPGFSDEGGDVTDIATDATTDIEDKFVKSAIEATKQLIDLEDKTEDDTE